MASELVPNLADCKTISQLATALGVDPEMLELLSSDRAEEYYRRHAIPKRSSRRAGEYRVVFEPASEELKQFHKTVARRLALYVTHADKSFPAECSLGYRRHRSIKDNAAKHCGAAYLLRADIRDFFPTVTRTRVEALLVRLGIPASSALLLSRVFCLEGTLTLGLSGSPLLANLACHDLDGRLTALANRFGATYTRYADDLSFSGTTLPSKAEIAAELETEGFSISQNKFRITRLGQAHFVTGLSVSDPKRPHVPRSMKRKLRQELYYCRKFGIEEHLDRRRESKRSGLNRIDGTVNYVSFIERGTSHDYRLAWDALLARDDVRPTCSPQHGRAPTQMHCAIDETLFTHQTVRYMAVAWVLFADIDRIETTVRKVLEEYLADPFSAGKKADIQKEGLHFSAAHAELQNQFILVLPTLPFRCYVTLKRFGNSADYSTTYLQLFESAVSQMYLRCDREKLKVFVEQNAHVSREDVESVFSKTYALSTRLGVKRPLVEPLVDVVSKQTLFVSLPDFMLGVLREFVEKNSKGGSASYVRFERLRDRFTHIYDLDRKRSYSRRRPFVAHELGSGAGVGG